MIRYILQKFIFLLCALGSVVSASAQISVSVPSKVQAGENFRLSYTIRTQGVEDFRAGTIPAGLEVIAGPYTSEQESFQMTNGHTSRSYSITYTYTLYADKAGTYTIPAAHAKIGGKQAASAAAKVTVTGQASNNGGQVKMHQDNEDEHQLRSAGKISGKDLFIKVSANKTRVHEQEPILLTYKVYTLVDLTQLEGKMPDLTGFHSQEVQLPQQKSFSLERVNGVPYRTVTWSQYVMYPQMTGKLEIPSITFKGIVVQQNRSVDPFEAFFNGGSGYVEVKRDIQAPGLTVQVDPLPQKPANFSGGVGRFNISAQLSKNEVKEGEAVTLRVVVGGIGNLKLIKLPEVQFPKNFSKYDPKITDKTKLSANGVEGNMVYDILFVPRQQGKYTIPAIDFVYFDTQSNTYKTAKTQAFDISVAKGDGKTEATSYEAPANNDIHGLKTVGEPVRSRQEECFFGSNTYWLSMLLPLAAFVVLLVLFRRRAIENADVINVRRRNADKIARKRLKKASQLMQQGKTGDFYDEVLRALWYYVGYKLNMPAERLSRDNIADELASHSVDTSTIQLFLTALDECEYERYAPGDEAGNMGKTYTAAANAITEIENVMKKKK